MSERQRELERSNRIFFARGNMLMMGFAVLIGVVGLFSVVPPVSYEATARLTVLRENPDTEPAQGRSFRRSEYSPWGGQLVAEGNSIEFVSRLVEATRVHEDESLSPDPNGATLLETAVYLRRATVVVARPDEGIVEISVVLENTRPSKVRWWANKVASALETWGQEMQLAEGRRRRERALQIREGFSDRVKQNLAHLESLGVNVLALDQEVLDAFRSRREGDAAIGIVGTRIKQRLLDLEAIERLGDSPTPETLGRLHRRSELLKVPSAERFLKAREDVLVYSAKEGRRHTDGDSLSVTIPEAMQQGLATSIRSTKEQFRLEIAQLENRMGALEHDQKQKEERYRDLVAARDALDSLKPAPRFDMWMLQSTAQTLRDVDPGGKLLRESIVFSERAEDATPIAQQLSARVLNLSLAGIILGVGLLWLVSLAREKHRALVK